MSEQQEFTNVRDALEDNPVERENIKLRSALMREVIIWFGPNNLNQTEATNLLQVSRSNLSNLLNGHIHLFTIDRPQYAGCSRSVTLNLKWQLNPLLFHSVSHSEKRTPLLLGWHGI